MAEGPQATRHAIVYRRENLVMVEASAETESGVHTSGGLVATCDARDTAAIGKGVLAALAAYRTGLPDDVLKTNGSIQEFLSAAGAKSWRAFVTTSRRISVRSRAGELALTPWARQGGSGFVPIGGRDRIVSDSSPDLGATIVAVLSDAE